MRFLLGFKHVGWRGNGMEKDIDDDGEDGVPLGSEYGPVVDLTELGRHEVELVWCECRKGGMRG